MYIRNHLYSIDRTHQVVGNSLKSLEVSEEKANQRVEEFKREMKTLTVRLKEAENRAESAEKQVKRLQKEVDRLEGILSFLHFLHFVHFQLNTVDDCYWFSQNTNPNFYIEIIFDTKHLHSCLY